MHILTYMDNSERGRGQAIRFSDHVKLRISVSFLGCRLTEATRENIQTLRYCCGIIHPKSAILARLFVGTKQVLRTNATSVSWMTLS